MDCICQLTGERDFTYIDTCELPDPSWLGVKSLFLTNATISRWYDCFTFTNDLRKRRGGGGEVELPSSSKHWTSKALFHLLIWQARLLICRMHTRCVARDPWGFEFNCLPPSASTFSVTVECISSLHSWHLLFDEQEEGAMDDELRCICGRHNNCDDSYAYFMYLSRVRLRNSLEYIATCLNHGQMG